MFFRHSIDKLIYPLIAVVVFVFASYRPKYHLRTRMPAAFYSEAGGDGSQNQSLQRKIALAYWQSARMDVQWRYSYGHPLPSDPPPLFHVDAQLLGPIASDPATRKLYWLRLQQVWDNGEAWEKQYQFDWNWASDSIDTGGRWLRERMSVH
jgi:hypothetical protein